MNPIQLHYSEPMIRRAVRAFWMRVVGWPFLVATLLVSASLVSLLAVGDRSWLVGAIGAALALVVLFAVALYVVHYRGSVGRFRRLKTPEATFDPGEHRFRVTSDAGLVEVPWKQ